LPYDFRKFFYCNVCRLYKCYNCQDLINDGFYGACEGGRLENVKLFYAESVDFEFFIDINKGLHLATKHRHFRIAEFLINKGAVYPKFVFEDFYNNLLNYI
jgi:ankyrin repeat protein